MGITRPSLEPARPRRKLIVATLGIIQIFAWGSTYYLPAVLAQPIASQTGWPLAWVIGGLSMALLVAGIASPQVGSSIQHSGGRLVLALSSLLLGAGLIGVASATRLSLYLLAWVVLGLGMACGLYDAAFATVGVLFGQDARSAITGLTLFGGFASAVCWPLSAVLLQRFGWRGTCLAYASFHLLLAMPACLAIVPKSSTSRRPAAAPVCISQTGPSSDTRTAFASSIDHVSTNYELNQYQLLLFCLLAASVTLGAVITSAMSVHLLTILRGLGASLADAVMLGTLVGPSQVGARLYEAVLGRRYHPTWTLILAGALMCSGLGVLLLASPIKAAGLVLYGGGVGLLTIARGTLPLALFAQTIYPSMLGRLALPSLLAQAATPPALALLLERSGAARALVMLTLLAVINLSVIIGLRMLSTGHWLLGRVRLKLDSKTARGN